MSSQGSSCVTKNILIKTYDVYLKHYCTHNSSNETNMQFNGSSDCLFCLPKPHKFIKLRRSLTMVQNSMLRSSIFRLCLLTNFLWSTKFNKLALLSSSWKETAYSGGFLTQSNSQQQATTNHRPLPDDRRQRKKERKKERKMPATQIHISHYYWRHYHNFTNNP
jgi:ligand-binding SRPBCC domain-containing protein